MMRRTLSRFVKSWGKSQTPLACPARMYPFAIVALGVFFMGLTFWRVPVGGYLVTSEISLPVANKARIPAGDRISAEVTDLTQQRMRQQIADAMRETTRQIARERGTPCDPRLSEHDIRQVQQRLVVSRVSQPGKERHVEVQFAGVDLQWSLAFVDNLVRDMLIVHATDCRSHTAAADQVRGARWRVEQLRHYERKSRFDLEDALNVYLERTLDGIAVASDGSSFSDSDRPRIATVAAQGVTAQQPHSNWEQLQDEFAQLTADLKELLTTVTPNHPRVREITLQMDEIRRHLETTAQYEDDPASLAQASGPGEFASDSDGPLGNWRPTSDGQDDPIVSNEKATYEEQETESYSAATDYRYRRQQYDEAIERREKAERELSALQARSQSAIGESSAWIGRVIRPAAMRQRIGGRPSKRTVWGVLLVAILCGAGASWGGGALQGRPRFNTVDELQLALRLPIVGQISLDAPAPNSRQTRRSSQVVSWTVRACEWGLGFMVLVVLWNLFNTSSAAEELLADPLGAFTQIVADSVAKGTSWLR